MNTYKITFKTQDGNINAVLVNAYTENQALRKFEESYTYDSIIEIESDNE